jgi:hypothetical protein
MDNDVVFEHWRMRAVANFSTGFIGSDDTILAFAHRGFKQDDDAYAGATTLGLLFAQHEAVSGNRKGAPKP